MKWLIWASVIAIILIVILMMIDHFRWNSFFNYSVDVRGFRVGKKTAAGS